GTVRLPRLLGMSRALDMILTGRPVAADEALQFGLANRVVPNGTLLETAEAMARQIAAFPRPCLRNDRASVWQQWQFGEAEALANDYRLGLQTLASGETASGAGRLSGAAGRHGRFDDKA